ncbi:hypothetical protein JTB14_003386 [Gonioctena quinquepunctata]|nr:hypothetical protein JTB14_003386 [Gonioctena quinquepunctata]
MKKTPQKVSVATGTQTDPQIVKKNNIVEKVNIRRSNISASAGEEGIKNNLDYIKSDELGTNLENINHRDSMRNSAPNGNSKPSDLKSLKLEKMIIPKIN